tara:strand:- start:64 stop:609 length:546 start_codon:yes stop_codon:yes gene_type:complete
MKRLIRKILREEIEKSDRHYKILDKISDHVHLPYFKSMEDFAIDEKDDQLYIMRKIYGNDIIFEYGVDDISYIQILENDKGNEVYVEYDDGYWEKYEYNDKGNMIYFDNSSEYSSKWEYDDKGNMIYYERSDGFWERYEYDDRGKLIYYEDSDGFWKKMEYDDKGNRIYYEDSSGDIEDNR